MEIFTTTLDQMLVLFLFIIVGFILNKTKLFPSNLAGSLSKLENYVLVPALLLNTFMSKCTVSSVSQKWVFIVYSIAIMCITVPMGFVLSRFFAKDEFSRHIYIYSFAVSNYSFMGTAIINGIYGSDVLFDYMMFIIPMHVFVYTIGIAMLTPGAKIFSVKSFLNPIFIAMIVGAALGLLNIQLPSFVNTAISSAASCMSPIAMILTGFVVADYDLLKLLKMKKVYIATFLRLILIPLVFISILKLIGTPNDILLTALTTLAMPLGLNTIVFPAASGGDTTLGASMALISHTLSVVTIPIMFMLLLG